MDDVISGERSGAGFIYFSCQLIFVLLDVGNIVIEMA